MTDIVLTDRLHQAIVLRQATRLALDIDDMQSVRLLNRLADDAYRELTFTESLIFGQWVTSNESELVLQLVP